MKKGKVGVLNKSFEMNETSPSSTFKEKVAPLLNNIRDAQAKNNNAKSKALANLINVKKTASRWKNFVNKKRIRKKSSSVVDTGTLGTLMKQKQLAGGLGLDDIHEEFLTGDKKVFGANKNAKSGMSVASNRALLQYFSKLSRTSNDSEVVDLDFIENLVNSGADINCTDIHGQTLLHEVASKWHVDVARFLIDLGADVNRTDNLGRTPLHVAAADNYPEMIDLLIQRGADREAKTYTENQTPVHFAARNDASEALKQLIKRNCEYKTIRDYKGRTPLHVAALLDRSETARILLDLDAPAGVTDDKGMSAVTWMITKMPPVASQAFDQFHVKDRPNRQQLFYLNFLVQDREKDPRLHTQTPLAVAVKYKQYDLLCTPVFFKLIDVMWHRFARWRSLGSLFFNFMYIMLWTVYGVFVEYDVRHKYILPEQWWRIALLLAAVGITLWQIVDELMEFKRSSQLLEDWKNWRRNEIEDDFKYCHPRWPAEGNFLKDELEKLDKSHTKYFSDMWNVFDWLCYVFLIAVISTHFADIFAHSNLLARAHIRLTAVSVILLWLRLFKNVRAYAFLGPFVVMLGAMTSDVIKFGFLYLEFFIPYLCAFWMIFGGNKYPENPDGSAVNKTTTEQITVSGFGQFNGAMFSMFRLTLVDDYDYDTMKQIDSIMADILVGSWLALSAILCLNLFIALLSDTFQRVYDNAHAISVMQKAISILAFWETLSMDDKNRFLDFIKDTCSPKEDYYDDDMTEGEEQDLKKVTIKIKDELDDLKEKWHNQFGDDDNDDTSALEELRSEDKKVRETKMVTTQKFSTEIENLRDEIRTGLLELQKQQSDTMAKFQQDLADIKALLMNGGSGRSGRPGRPGQNYPQMIGQSGYHDDLDPTMALMSMQESSNIPTKPRKKKKKPAAITESPLPGEVLPQPGIFATSGDYGSSTPREETEIVNLIAEQGFQMDDFFGTEVRPPSRSYSRDVADHSTA